MIYEKQCLFPTISRINLAYNLNLLSPKTKHLPFKLINDFSAWYKCKASMALDHRPLSSYVKDNKAGNLFFRNNHQHFLK